MGQNAALTIEAAAMARPGCRVSPPPLTYLVVHLVVVLKVSFLPGQDVDVDVRHGLARLGTVLDAERERVLRLP